MYPQWLVGIVRQRFQAGTDKHYVCDGKQVSDNEIVKAKWPRPPSDCQGCIYSESEFKEVINCASTGGA